MRVAMRAEMPVALKVALKVAPRVVLRVVLRAAMQGAMQAARRVALQAAMRVARPPSMWEAVLLPAVPFRYVQNSTRRFPASARRAAVASRRPRHTSARDCR